MRTRSTALLALAVAGGLVACSTLFGDATQCTTDADCARFAGAVCDTQQRVCVSSTNTEDAAPPQGEADQQVPGEGSPTDSGTPDGNNTVTDAPAAETDPPDIGPPDPCKALNKPEIIVTGTAGTPLTDGGAPTVEITADVSFTCGNDYVLKGPVVVRSGATLTIAKGTTIKGDVTTRGALYIMPGAKLEAAGTAANPILFTSSKAAGARLPNDWAGLFVLGNAGPAGQLEANPALAYGGGAATDNSGTLSYVRVEYSGAPLVVAGAGNATKLDFVQTRRTLDNCFRFNGGTVNGKHLACQAPRAEGFEFTGGYVGKVQFVIVQGRASTPRHQGLLINGSFVTAFNTTLCGDAQANIGYGLSPRNTTQMHLANMIFTGYSAGMVVFAPLGTPFDLNSSIAGANSEPIAYLPQAGVTNVDDPYYDNAPGFNVFNWFNDVTHKNTVQDPGLSKCLANPPVFGPATAFEGLAETPPVDGFFDPAIYIGAAKDVNDTWATGAWASWAGQ